MSTPEKPHDPARGWMFVEKLLAEEAEEEVERVAKLTDEALDAEIRERGGDPERVPTAEHYLAKAKARAATTAAPAPATPAPATPAPATHPGAPVVRIRRRWRTALIVLAAAFAGAFVIVYVATAPPPVAAPPTPKEEAEGEREIAVASCAEKDWRACKKYLDRAAALDPAGESEPRVQKARAEIAAATADHGSESGAP